MKKKKKAGELKGNVGAIRDVGFSVLLHIVVF
jgi:hypothetical protein